MRWKPWSVLTLTLTATLLMAACSATEPLSGLGPTPADGSTPFKVGAARILATPPLPICTGGYGIFCNRRPTTVRENAIGGRDELFTRALVIDNSETALVIVTTSAIGLFAAYKAPLDDPLNPRPGLFEARQRIASALGIPVSQVLIQPDHSHYAADTVGIWGGATDGERFTEYLRFLVDTLVEAAVEAHAAREPAGLWLGRVHGDRVHCPDDAGVCRVASLYGFAPNLDVDDEFRVLEARRGDGSRIATLVNYSTHATVLRGISQDTTISADWAGWLARAEDGDERCGGAGQARCPIGLVTLGTLGRTDFNPGTGAADGSGPLASNLARERAARARLRHFLALVRGQVPERCLDERPCVERLRPLEGQVITASESLIRTPVAQAVFYANYLPLVGLPPQVAALIPSESEFVTSFASIERSVLPPWLVGNLLGTVAGAARIGEAFFGVAPSEQFPNSQFYLRDEGGVTGPGMHFFLGVTNDFVGYTAPTETYDQVTAQGALFLAGCPENALNEPLEAALGPLLGAIGYESGRLFDPTCPDHWILMAAPNLGDQIICAIQAAATDIGFAVDRPLTRCAVFNALAAPAPR